MEKQDLKTRILEEIDCDDGFLDIGREDDFMQEKYNRSVSFFDRERSSLDSIYDRDLPLTGKEVKLSVQMERYRNSPHLLLDRSRSREIKSGCRGAAEIINLRTSGLTENAMQPNKEGGLIPGLQ